MLAEGDAARAGHARERRHHAFLQRARRDRDLEGRAGGEHALHGAVVEGVLLVLDQRAPLRAPDAAREHVGVVGGVRDHREHLAAAWVERDDRTVGLAEGAVGGFLEVTVEGERERPAGAVRLLLQHPDAAAERIHLHLLVTGVAAQVLVEALLEARLADQVAAHVVAVVLRELALAHLADVAEEMRGERPERIVAFRRDPQRDAGQVELVRLERDHPLPVDVSPEHDALVALAVAPGAVYPRVEPRLLLAEISGERLQDLAPALTRVLGHEDDVERGAVVDQDLAVAVVDDTPRRRHAHQPDAVLLGVVAHLRTALDLEVPEADPDQREGDEHDADGDHHAELELRRHLARDDVNGAAGHLT